MSTAAMTFPANPDTIVTRSLDDDGWIPYDLGDDVLSGEPNTRANILRTVGITTPILAASFFSAEPLQLQMGVLARRDVRPARGPHRDHLRHRRKLRPAAQRRHLDPRRAYRNLRGPRKTSPASTSSCPSLAVARG
jgi:hypothetical protein